MNDEGRISPNFFCPSLFALSYTGHKSRLFLIPWSLALILARFCLNFCCGKACTSVLNLSWGLSNLLDCVAAFRSREGQQVEKALFERFWLHFGVRHDKLKDFCHQ